MFPVMGWARPCFPSDNRTVKSGRMQFLSFIKQLTTMPFLDLGSSILCWKYNTPVVLL